MDDDEIREVRGVLSNNSPPARVSLVENTTLIRLDLGSYTGCELSPVRARSLARDLNRLARRIEKRSEG